MDKVMVTQEELRDRIAAGLRLAATLACDVPITTQAWDTLNHAKDALARLSPAPEGVDATAEQVRMREALELIGTNAAALAKDDEQSATSRRIWEFCRDEARAALTPPPKGQNDG